VLHGFALLRHHGVCLSHLNTSARASFRQGQNVARSCAGAGVSALNSSADFRSRHQYCYPRRSRSGVGQKGNAMAAEINIYNPEELGPPMGQYTHVARVRANEFLFIAGMLSGDAAGNVIGEGDFDVQTAQVFRNIEAALKSAGASWANVVQFTTYLVHSQDIPKFMAFRLREFPKMFPDGKYPPNTLLMVDRLVKEAFLVEVQTIAAV
jgi:enamine deaminase RidA (YjgF/YER057c/UK114 family)